MTRRLVLPTLLLAAWFVVPSVAQSDDDAASLRDYHSANGLLNRGLYDLATEEYRKFLDAHGGHPKAPVARYGLAVCLFRTERFEEASAELTRLHRERRFDYAAEVATMLGQCRMIRGEYAEAAKVLSEVVERHADHELADDAAAYLVESLYRAGERDKALRCCDELSRRWAESPLRPRAEFFGALAEMGGGEYAKAASRFEELLAKSPDGPLAEQAALLLAQCHHRDNALDRAAGGYRRIIEAGAGRYLPDALLGLAMLLQQQEQPAEAGKLLDRLIEGHPQSPLLARARLQRGRAWFDQGEYDRALSAFDAVGDAEKTLVDDATYWRAKCRLRQGAHEEVARVLRDALQRFEDSDLRAEMAYDRAIALVQLDNAQPAIEALEEFRAEFAKHALAPDALQLLALVTHRAGDYERSQACCQRFIKQYASHALIGTVRFLVAENEFLRERYSEAAIAYREFLDDFAQHAEAAKARFRLGMALYRLNRGDEAIELLQQAAIDAEKDAVFRTALLALGDIHFGRGEWKQAEELMRRYLAGGDDVPSADDALLKLGLSLQRQGRHEPALEAFDRLLGRADDSPHRLQALFERGQSLVALERLDEAAAVFERVLAEDPHSRFAPYAHNHLGAIALKRGEFELAADWFAQVNEERAGDAVAAEALFLRGQALMAAEQFEPAREAFERFGRKHGEHVRAGQAAAQLAIALSRLDRFDDALKAIGSAERAAAKLPASLRASLRYEKAWCLRKSGDEEQAAAAYRELLQAEDGGGENVHALLELAEIEAGAKRYAEARTLLRRLRERAASDTLSVPADVRELATYRLAVCEFELGDSNAAAALFDEFVAQFPDSNLLASASLFAGESFFKIDQYKRAATHLERVVERFSSDPACEPAMLRLGESLARLQHWPHSERVFSDYLTRFADREQWFQAQFGVGWACENQKRYDEAIATYRKVVERHKGETAARAQFQIGECLFAKNEYDGAVRELLKVDILYGYPEWSAAALYEAGRCFEQLGKLVEARQQYQSVAQKYKQTRWAATATKRLAEVSGGALPGRGRDGG